MAIRYTNNNWLERQSLDDDASFYFGDTTDIFVAAKPLGPIALPATKVSIISHSFQANWEPLEDADGFFLDVATDALFSNLIVDDLELSGSTYLYRVNNVLNYITYYYRLRALFDSQISLNSNIIATMLPSPFNGCYVGAGGGAASCGIRPSGGLASCSVMAGGGGAGCGIRSGGGNSN